MGRRSKQEELLDMARHYMDDTGVTEVDIDALADWAIQKGLYQSPPKTMRQRAKEEFSRALRGARHVDPQGRSVRTMHPVPVPVLGEQLTLDFTWVDIRTARPDQAKAALSYRRQGILADVKRHKDDTDSYNDNNVYGAQIPLFDYDFNKDVEESNLPSEYNEDEVAFDLDAELELA